MYKTLRPSHSNVVNEVPGYGSGVRKMGDACWVGGHYVVKLNLFPRHTYYLKPHPDRVYDWILYARWSKGELSSPVGRGVNVPGTNYVEVKFLDLKLTFCLQHIRSSFLESKSA